MNWGGKTIWSICCVVGCILSSDVVRSAEPDVYCAAVQQDNRVRRPNAPGPSGPIELIVVGYVRSVEGDGHSRTAIEIDVEDVLYGFTDKRRLRAENHYVTTGQRRIVALCANSRDDGAAFAARYDLPAEESWSQRPLARARLDFNVLSAKAIFVGKARAANVEELQKSNGGATAGINEFDIESMRLVDVERVLSGSPIRTDAPIVVEVQDGAVLEALGGRSDSALYFVGEIEAPATNRPAIYRTRQALLPVECEREVVTALARKESYTVRAEVDREGKSEPVREIVFSGTIDEAIHLLASESDAAGTLGARRLLLSGSEAVAPAAAIIRKELTLPVLSVQAARQQRNLILLLSILAAKNGEARRAFTDLLDTLITAIEQGAEPPKWPEKFEATQYRYIQAGLDANHSLAWLVEEAATDHGDRRGDAAWNSGAGAILENPLDSNLMEQFAARLIHLRKLHSGVWARELQLSLDLGRIEDRREIAGVVKANEAVTVLQSERAGWVGGSEMVAWSQDGKYLATIDDPIAQIWNTTDWSVKSAFAFDGSVTGAAFSNDGRFVFIAGGGGGLQIHRRVDCQTGRTVQEYVGHHTGLAHMQLSAAHDVMVTSSFYEDKLFVWQLPEGRIIREIDLVDVACNFALSPDGKTLLREVDMESHWLAEDLLGQRQPVTLECQNARFLPDGRLFTLQRLEKQDGKDELSLVWRERRSEDDFAFKANDPAAAGFREARWLTPRKAQNPFGRNIEKTRAPGDEFAVTIVSQPDERQIASFEVLDWPAETSTPECMEFSPDGTLLAIGERHVPFRLFRIATGERLVPGNAHVGWIAALRFSPDGHALETFGDDGLVVTWDAASLNRLARRPGRTEKPVALDKSAPAAALRGATLSEDGKRYYLLGVAHDIRFRFVPVEVIDAATGKTLAEKQIELPWWPSSVGSGLIAGGKYFHIGTQIYDRDTLTMVAGRRFPRLEIRKMVLSPDGARYALVARDPNRGGAVVVRIQQTLSGKTIDYREVQSGLVRYLTFSPDGKRLAFLAEDNTLRLVPLP